MHKLPQARSNFPPRSLLNPFDRRLSVGGTGSTTEHYILNQHIMDQDRHVQSH